MIGIVPDLPALMENAGVRAAVVDSEGEGDPVQSQPSRRRQQAGIDVARANADMTAISKRLEPYPDDNKDWGARPLQEDMIGDVRRSLMVLLAVALVPLITLNG